VLGVLEQAQAAVYLAYFHFRFPWVLDPGPACEEVSVDQAGQWAWAGCLGRMRREEVLGNLDQEEGRREACHNQAAAVRIRSEERRLERLGNHAVHQGPGSELAAGTAAAAGQEGNRKEGREAAAGQADRGTEEAAGSEAADGAAVAAVAEQGGLTAINVSLSSTLVQYSHICKKRKTRNWTVACLPPQCCHAYSAMATYPPKLHPHLKPSSSR
jgi:hypothetical protein